jgi:predicted NBD/HSP70 family sugar kinase
MPDDKRPGLPLVAPRVTPVLDPRFRPAALACRALEEAGRGGSAVWARFALEQPDGSVSRFATPLVSGLDPLAPPNLRALERLVKLALWSRGGYRIHLDAPAGMAEALRAHFAQSPTGIFDARTVCESVYDRPLEIVPTRALPPEQTRLMELGRHLEGCRIGFDLGGSDRKAAAVIDGKVVWSEEIEWDPYRQPDPRYHWEGIMDSLRRAAAHLPRVDAIGCSAAGVYVDNRIKFASLFRAVPRDVFAAQVQDMFLELRRAWNGVPFDVVNDGEVTALAGSMALGENAVVGIALGTSTAAGFVGADGRISSWLNELAFVPIDYRTDAPPDEWSGDRGCTVQYLSQQAVGRLLAPAGIELPSDMRLPERLKEVQRLMLAGDRRARDIYQTIGVYLGHALAHFARVYDFRHVFLLGRVTSGAGGDILLETAQHALQADFPALAERVSFHVPSELDRRHGQAIAAASLPVVAH